MMFFDAAGDVFYVRTFFDVRTTINLVQRVTQMNDCSYIRIWSPHACGDYPYAYGEEGKKDLHMGTPRTHNKIVRIR